MARLIFWNVMTLDGMFQTADPDPMQQLSFHGLVWGQELSDLSDEQCASAGGYLFGRRTYEMMGSYWATAEPSIVADSMNQQPKFVFSHALKEGSWGPARIFSGEAAPQVVALKREVERDIFLFGSADLAGQLLPHGLFDEIRLCIAPIMLGAGVPLFKPGAAGGLKLLESRALNCGGAFLRYAPV